MSRANVLEVPRNSLNQRICPPSPDKRSALSRASVRDLTTPKLKYGIKSRTKPESPRDIADITAEMVVISRTDFSQNLVTSRTAETTSGYRGLCAKHETTRTFKLKNVW